jgi:Domain of Unknown Function with PDB structure (DUF3857)/Transglutaminase-like superfamily
MRTRHSVAVAGLTLAVTLAAPRTGAQELPNLPPLSKDDLTLKDNPAARGAAAMILYYGVETDNTKSTETHATRLKVFRNEGKKYADIEIPYFNKEIRVEEIRARTIGADGKASEFGDQIYDREIVKAKKYHMYAKVFTLPNVQVGSIIEYSYRLQFKGKIPDVFRHPLQYALTAGYTYPAAQWNIQRDLFVRRGHFSLRRVSGAMVMEHHVGMPAGTHTSEASDGSIRLDVENVPPYEEEECSPPEETLKARTDLYYAAGYYGSTSYWMDFAKRTAKEFDSFIKKSKAIEREAARLAAGADSEEAKLRKIYGRVQQIRAVTYEAEKTEKERKQENLLENKNVEEVLNRGYGYGNQINLLFVALARAAGFEAYPMMVTSRRQGVFMEDYPNGYQLNTMVVQVRAGSNFLYLDPATKFCPFGLLPWEETDAGGVRVDSARPELRSTPGSKSSDAAVRRKAALRLSEEGALRGKVEVVYFGQEALSMRLEANKQDDAARRKELEESLKKELAPGATVNVTEVEGWDTGDTPLKTVFEVEVPNFATRAGKRLVLPLGVFHTTESNPFPSARRVNPIYFSYPQETQEEVAIELSPGMQVESLPSAKKADEKAAYYDLSAVKDGNTIRISRNLRLHAYLFERQQYPVLRAFYSGVLAGDSQQATLLPAPENGSN